MIKKRRIQFALLGAIIVFMLSNFLLLVPPRQARAMLDEYWRGTTDQKMDRIQQDIEQIKKDIKGLCDTQTTIQVETAKLSSLYGGGAGLGIYLIGALIGALKKKKGE